MVGLSWSHPRWSTPIAFNWPTQSGKMSTSSERRQPTSPKSGFTGTQESNAKQSRSNIKVRASILFCSSQTARRIFKCFSHPLDFYIWLWVCLFIILQNATNNWLNLINLSIFKHFPSCSPFLQSRPIEMRIFHRNERCRISAILRHRRKLFYQKHIIFL